MPLCGFPYTFASVTLLAEWLDRHGVTVQDLARAAGDMRYHTVWDVVRGNSRPRVETARQLARATEVLAAERGLSHWLSAAEILGVADSFEAAE